VGRENETPLAPLLRIVSPMSANRRRLRRLTRLPEMGAGALLWEIDKANFFFDAGLGGAIRNGDLHGDDHDEKHFGSRVLFYQRICLGYSFAAPYRLALVFDHISNANLAEPNNGLNMIGISVQYSF
jgi:hypothetical protein